MAVITISREAGTLGEEIGARLAGFLGYMLVDRVCLSQYRQEMGLDAANEQSGDAGHAGEVFSRNPEGDAFLGLLPDLLAHLAEDHDLVVIGRGGQGLFHDRPGALHVRIVASRDFRVRVVQSRVGLSARQARRHVMELDARRSRYVRMVYGLNWADPSLYDLTLRMDRLSLDQALNLIVAAVDEMNLQQVPRRLIVESLLPGAEDRRSGDPFANDTEREFARFLDFYRIPYQYEPRTFSLELDDQGNVLEAFTPDFYLPEQDLFIELTTMKQSLVTRKNRKVRRLRQLYPEVNIRVFYQRDFYSLLAKYGLLKNTSEKIAGLPDHD